MVSKYVSQITKVFENHRKCLIQQSYIYILNGH